MSVLWWVLLAVASAVIEAELIAWCRPLQRWLIRRAAAPLPEPHKSRYLEEWYAELKKLPDGPVTRLCYVVHLVLRRASLARALGVPRAVIGFEGGLKRLIDIVLTASALMIIAPLLIAICICIKGEDGGPLIAKQRRVGLNGEPFNMLTFRTWRYSRGRLRVDPFSGNVDLRPSHVGTFLFGFSLDDLPVLFNVLGGSMSLVGPRPYSRNESTYAASSPIVRPGLTSREQMEGRPNGEEATRHDREYAKHWSLWLDIKILHRTVLTRLRHLWRKAFRSHSAYAEQEAEEEDE